MSTIGTVISVGALLALLFFMGRGVPARRWLAITAATLCVVVLIVAAEQAGVWPRGWVLR